MATPADNRDPTLEFRQGCVDSTYIQLAPDTGGLVETRWRVDRAINQMPYSYLNVEVHGADPFDLLRLQRAGRPIEPYSRYVPRRDIVSRPMSTERPVR